MWILINEIIVFGIMLALVFAYFGGFGLGVNKEINFKEKVNYEIEQIRKNISGDNDIKYKIKRLVSYTDNGQRYLQYKVIFTDSSGNKLTGDKFKDIVDNRIPKSSDNNNDSTKQEPIFDDNFIIYYGSPLKINGSRGNVLKAEDVFKKYKIVVLGFNVKNLNYLDYKRIKQIIKDLKGKTKFYGYIDMVKNGNNSFYETIKLINIWDNLGLEGIFINKADYNYWTSYTYLSSKFYRQYLQYLHNYIKAKGLNIIYNTWNPSDLFNNLKLSSEDIIMIEKFYYSDGIKKNEYVQHVEYYENVYKKSGYKPKIMCIATAGTNNQNKINNIKSEIASKMNKICDYRTIQDDYGEDNTVYTPSN